LGYGVGDAKKILIDTFKEKNIPFSGNKWNFHNQYLQSWTEVGILGVLLLMFMLLRPFFEKGQHPLFLIFLGLTLIGFMTESMLERQSGVVFFAFMYPLLSGLRGKEVE
jgi:O-antigen ligase